MDVAATGQSVPALLNKPDLRVDLGLAWDAFWALSGDRHLGMVGVGPLPFTAIDRAAERFGITGRDEFQRFHALLRAMDGAYQTWLAERKPGPGPKPEKA